MAYGGAESDSDDFVLVDNYDVEHHSDAYPPSPESSAVVKKIQAWLLPTDFGSDMSEYKKHLNSRVQGTGEWLRLTDQYEQWHQSADVGALWIRGIPGSGKSVIAASLIQHLIETTNAPVLFFFFRHIILSNRGPQSLIRDCSYQLLEHSPLLQSRLKHVMAEHPDVEQVPRAELWKCFVSAMTAMSKVYCVIDALDEMEAGSDNFLEDIVQLAQQKPSSVKLAMASRQLPHIEAVFKGQSSVDIRLEKRMIDKDIVTYITHRLKTQQLRVLSDEDQQAIKEAICSKGQSLFLYARLMIAEVLQHSQSLHAQLSQLPGSLSDMYTNTLNEHSVRSGVTHQFQLFVLQWVTHCSRPLRLIELAIITNFMPGSSGFKDLQDAKRAVRTACGPLLEILEDESVQVIHHSFTEFLLDVERSRNLQEPDTHGYFPIITPSATHLMMAAICVDYLSSGCFESWSVESRSKEPQTCGWRRSLEKPHKNQLLRYPFLQYASQNWPLHVASCDGLNAGLRSRLDDFLRDGSHDFESWKDFWSSFAFSMPEDFSPLHVAAQCGLAAYAKHLLEIGVSPDLRDGFGRTPISYASAQGHSGTLSMLLDHHAQPSIEDHLGLAPIHYSAKANHAKALHILLMAGVNPMTPELKANPYLECDGSVSTLGYTPIYYACQLGNVQAAAELLRCIDPKDIENGLLHLAAEKGRAEVVSLLLQHEQIAASIDSIDKLGDTPLFLAASARDPATIRILLKHGADVNARSEGIPNRWHATHATRIIWRKRNLTPLHGWAKSPTYPKGQDSSIAELAMSAKLLIEGGCDVNATDDQGQTALFSWTEQCNHVEAFVSILLKHGANPSAIDETGSTPLHYLRRRKSEGVLNLLVKSGADIDAVSRDGRTPLIAAAAGQYLQTEIFKEHGADFNHTDEDGNTALHFACRSWCLEQSDMKKWLAVANPTVQNNLGHTCLFNLPWNNGAELVDSIPLLMHRGVDLETRDHLGRTALLHAACNGAKTFVQGLVQHGADVTAKDFQGKRVLHLLATSRVCYYDAGAADIQEKVKLIRSLVEAGADIQAVDLAGNTIFHDAASWNENWGHVRTALEAIVKTGGVANLPNLHGRTGLHCAIALKEDDESSQTACIGFATRIDFLLQPSLAFDINARDHEGITPLHLASSVSEVNVWKLIRAGADIRAIDFQGRTPLHVAATAGESNVVALLSQIYKENSWPTNSRDRKGRTPLHEAARHGESESVKFLLDCGASPACKDKRGRTPLHAAAEFQRDSMILKMQRDYNYQKYPHNEDPLKDHYAKPKDADRMCLTVNNELDARQIRSVIRLLLEAGADTAQLDNHDHTAFDVALIMGCEQVVDELSPEMRQLFFRATTNGTSELSLLDSLDRLGEQWYSFRTENASLLVESMNLSPDEASHHLNRAVLLGDEALVKALLKAGADPTYTNSDALTVLHVVALWGLTSFMKIMALHVKDLNAISPPLLHVATERRHSNLEMFKLLIKLGLDVNAQHEKKLDEHNPPLRYTVMHLLANAKYWWHPTALKLLIDAGADLEISNNKGNTAIQIALVGGDEGYYHSRGFWSEQSLAVLMERGANVNVVSPGTDLTPLNLALESNRGVEIVRTLLSNGTDVSVGTKPAIFSAIEGVDLDSVELLLASGADCNALYQQKQPKRYGEKAEIETPLLAITCPDHHIGDLEESTGRAKTALRTRIITRLLEHGADPNMTLDNGNTTVLHEISKVNGFIGPIVSFGVDLETRDSQSRTPLLAACTRVERGYPVVDGEYAYASLELIRAGADILASDDQGSSALHYAVKAGFEKAVDLLLERGASVSAKDHAGFSALYYALSHRYDSFKCRACTKLLDKGADPLIVGPDGQTALHYLAPGLMGYSSVDGQDRLQQQYGDENSSNGFPEFSSLYQRFIDAGCDRNARDNAGNTPLFAYVATVKCYGDGYFKAIPPDPKDQRQMFADHDIWTSNKEGNTLLHVVAERDIDEEMPDDGVNLFKMLVDLGLDPRAENNNHITPLDVAAACDNHRVLALFAREEYLSELSCI